MNEMEKKELLVAARKDKFVFSSHDVDDAVWLLDEISNATKVHSVTSPKVTRCPKGDTRLFPGEFKKLNLKQETVSSADYNLETEFEDCAESTGLLISGDDGATNFLTRECAGAGINDATRVKGKGLSDLYQKDRDRYIQTVNNLFWGRGDSPLTFIEVMGRVTGVASGIYRHLDQKQLLQSFLIAAAENDGELSNFNYSHELTYATAKFPSEKVKAYAVDRLGFDPNKSSMEMTMKNSVTRSSAARVYFTIKDGDKEIAALGAYTAHKGNSAVENFALACLGMTQALQQTVNDLLDLSALQLLRGESTVREVARRVGISEKKIVEEIKNAKRNGIDFNSMSAYEGYLFLNRVIDDAPLSKSKTKGFSGNVDLIGSYIRSELKARVVVQRWSEIDQILYFDEVDASSASDVDPRQISLLDEEVVV